MEIFREYPSIVYSDDVVVEKFKNIVNDYEVFCVTEKIHGSNTGITYVVDEDKYYFQSRNKVLEDNESHYNIRQLAETRNIKKLIKGVLELDKKIKVVTVFGEVYGGIYPELKDESAETVFRGVYYSPHNEFAVFDILVEVENGARTFLPFSYVKTICDEMGVQCVPILQLGMWEDCIGYINNADSVMPILLGLPRLKNNTGEGVVIRPFHKDLWVDDCRVMVKSKNRKFKELEHSRANEIKEKKDNDNANASIEFFDYLTRQRLDNVISHMPDKPKINQFVDVLQAFVEDALKDFKFDGDYDMEAVKRVTSRKAAEVVREYFMEL